MPHVLLPPAWRLPESAVTPASVWMSRRDLLRGLGATGTAAGLAAGSALSTLASGCALSTPRPDAIPTSYAWTLPPVLRNPAYADVGRPLTAEAAAASYNNFYEFTTKKDEVWRLAGSLRPRPWTLEVSGACNKPQVFDLETLLARMPLEERIYRFRCVEAWSMVVPWTGFPLRALLDAVEPRHDANYVRLYTLNDPTELPGIATQPWYPWPYYEALTIAEAVHELTLLAVGIYGHALPNQHGAPIRLVTPWKYGYKNIKSIVRIELVDRRPPTFWSDLAADEYDFDGNVRPDRPHPRWSQASEKVLPTGESIPTLPYNGYAEQVAGLYPG